MKEQVDTVVVTGCVTSGCIRATVIDSFSHRFRTIVPEDCVGDHDEGSHQDNQGSLSREPKRHTADLFSMTEQEGQDADSLLRYFEVS